METPLPVPGTDEKESLKDYVRHAIPMFAVLQWSMTAFQGGTSLVAAFAMHAFLLLSVLGILVQGAARVPGSVTLLLAVGGVLCTVFTVLSPATGPALQQLSDFLVIFVLVWAVVSAPRMAALQWSVAIWAGCAHAAWACWGAVSHSDARATGGFLSALDLGCFLAPLFVEALARAMRSARGLRLLYSAAAFLLGVGVLLSGSRIAAAALIVAPLPLIAPLARRKPVVSALLLAVVVCSAAGVIWRRSVSPDSYAYTRLYIWRDSVALWRERPWGTGLGAYADAMRVHGVRLPGLVSYPKVAGSAHNEWIQDLVETGLVGGLYLAVVAIATGRSVLRLRSDREQWPRLCGVGLALLVPSVAHITLHEQPLAVLTAIWLGEVLAGARNQVEQPAGSRRSIHAWAWMAAASLAVALPGVLCQGYIYLAELSYKRGNIPRALARAERASRLAPFVPEPILLQENLRYFMGEDPMAISKRLESAMKRFPSSVELPLTAASMTEAARGPEEDAVLQRRSAGLLAVAAARNPKRALAWVAVARAWVAARDSTSAAAAVERALQVEPNCAQAHAIAAVLAKRRADRAAARDHADKARRFDALKGDYDGYARAVLSLDPFTNKMLADAGL